MLETNRRMKKGKTTLERCAWLFHFVLATEYKLALQRSPIILPKKILIFCIYIYKYIERKCLHLQ